ncbi:MAG: hypothetical protein LC715_02775 [Gammaproteobacteria bacterium]|nr:hypothetical protein [Gammaproteobacteria bacterium]
MTLPPLAGRIELRDGRWRLASAGKGPATPSTVTLPQEPVAHRYAVPLAIGAVVLALALWLHRRRHRRVRKHG